jgi:hypothetical protein
MSNLERYAPLTGVVVVILTVVGLILTGEGPDFIGDPEEIADYYADDSGKLIGGYFIDALSAFFLIWFAGSVRVALRAVEGAMGRLSAVAFGGAVAAAAMFLLFDISNMAAAFRADEDGAIDPTVAASLYDLGSVALGIGGAIASAVFVAATAVVALRGRAVIPAWFAWVSLVLALALLIGPIAWAALIGFLAWILILSIALFIAEGRAAEPGPAGPAPGAAGPST